MTLSPVSSTKLPSKMKSLQRSDVVRLTGAAECSYTLCKECEKYLTKPEEDEDDACLSLGDEWSVAWPGFFHAMLFGKHVPKFGGGGDPDEKNNEKRQALVERTHYHYYRCTPEKVWRLVPTSLRPWWIDAARSFTPDPDTVPEKMRVYPYRNVTVDEPPSIFKDLTLQLKKFGSDYTYVEDGDKERNIGNMAKWRDAVNNIDVVDRRVLCPFSCSTSAIDAGNIEFDIMAQRILPDTVLPVVNKTKMKLVLYSWNPYYRELHDQFANILMNPEWTVMPSIFYLDRIVNGGIFVLTCKNHDGGRHKLTLYPPRSCHSFAPGVVSDRHRHVEQAPYHILNPRTTDQLAHAVHCPRVASVSKMRKFAGTYSQVRSVAGFYGTDTCNLRKVGDHSFLSDLSGRLAAVYLQNRPDMMTLLETQARERVITSGTRNNYLFHTRFFADRGHARRCVQGATYVAFEDMIRIHLFENSDNTSIRVEVPRTPTRFNPATAENIFVQRSWSPFINLLQTEDVTGYGTQVQALPKLDFSSGKGEKPPSMLTWILVGVLSGCSELWRVVDSLPIFAETSWEGWVLRNIQCHLFSFHKVGAPHKSPFVKLSLTRLAKKVNKCVRRLFADDAESAGVFTEAQEFFKYGPLCFLHLFSDPLSQYNRNIAVQESMDHVRLHGPLFNKSKVILIAGSEPPEREMEIVAGTAFHLRVVVCVCSKALPSRPSFLNKYDGVRYVCHRKGFAKLCLF